jgi:hypothetical protein
MSSLADTLIVPQGQGWQLALNSNELAVVYTHTQSVGPAPYYTELVQGGATNTLYLHGFIPGAFVGPLQIGFKKESGHLIHYKKLSGTVFQSLVTRSGDTNTLSVPEGKTLRFYSLVPPMGDELPVRAELHQGTNAFSRVHLVAGMELSGPIQITVTLPYADPLYPDPGAAVYTYYITEDFMSEPNTGLLQGPTGNFQLSVEKSLDLTNWFPSVLQRTSDDQKAFYRLGLSR